MLDEVHHLAERRNGEMPAWASNIAELAGEVETHNVRVTGILNLSGTLWRSMPGERISTVRYRTVEENRVESLVDFDMPVGDLVSRGELRPLDLYRLGAHVRVADYHNLEYLNENADRAGPEARVDPQRDLGASPRRALAGPSSRTTGPRHDEG